MVQPCENQKHDWPELHVSVPLVQLQSASGEDLVRESLTWILFVNAIDWQPRTVGLDPACHWMLSAAPSREFGIN